MPNTRAAAKRVRADSARHERRLAAKSELKTLTRRFLHLLRDRQKEQASTFFRQLTRTLDQAASRGLLHRNTASRRKSRLARQLAAR